MAKRLNYPKKLFLSFSIFVLFLVLVLFTIMLGTVYKGQYEKSVETQTQLAVKISEQLDTSIQGLDRIINGLLFNKNFIQLMKEDVPSNYTEYSQRILTHFVAMDAPIFATHRIIAFDQSTYYNFGKLGEDVDKIKDTIPNYPWREQVYAQNGKKLIIPVHQDPFEVNSSLVYSVARTITDGKQSYGILEVQNSYKTLADICYMDSKLGQTIIWAEDGSQIYPRESNDDLQLFYKSITSKAASKGSHRFKQYQLSYHRSDYSGWTSAVFLPVTAVVPYAFELAILAILTLAAVVGVSLWMVKVLSYRLTAPLVQLNKALSNVSLENLTLHLPQEYGIEEIDTINHSFQEMFRQLRESISRSVQARANEERANYLALESQMNPHTIYNTLGMIESVSYVNGDTEVSNLCICFSKMLRYVSDYTSRTYTLQDELEHLKNYATLIQKRYEKKLEIHISADTMLLSKIMPKFTLQPLVENSVKHGFGKECECLRVDVEASVGADGRSWQIAIVDNGCGWLPERLLEVRRQLLDCDEALLANSDVINKKIGNLALSNIYIRCRIMYSDAFDISINNRTNSTGASVLLFFKEEATGDDSYSIG